MTRTMKAIPTKWRGVQFRSRLEARWAAFFTALGWDWSYEPIDLDGYIPDFFLHMKQDVLVEVKPFMRLEDPVIGEALLKIRNSGWVGRHVVVGARFPGHTIGVSTHVGTEDNHPIQYDGFPIKGHRIVAGRCDWCSYKPVSISGVDIDIECWLCGRHPSKDDPSCNVSYQDSYGSNNSIKWRVAKWDAAGNEVQWMGRDA